MKNKKVTKLWRGKYVSVRDYEVQQAINQGGLRVTHNDKIMELKPEELETLKSSATCSSGLGISPSGL